MTSPVTKPWLSDPAVVSDSGDWVLLGTHFFEAQGVRRAQDGEVTVEANSQDGALDAALQAFTPRRAGGSSSHPFAYRNDAHLVQVTAVESHSAQGRCVWSIKLTPQVRPQGGSMDEMAVSTQDGHFSADDIARIRAARILFESPPAAAAKRHFSSASMVEMQVQKPGGLLVVDRCIVQDAYKQYYPTRPDVCAQLARLAAIWAFKATNTVEYIESLVLGPIEAGRLNVKFRGRRRKVYANGDPPLIELEGACELLLPVEFTRPAERPQIDESPKLSDKPLSKPSKLKVLLVSASPDSDVRLRVDREFREIIAQARGARLRDRLEFVQLQAARFGDLRTALLEHEPHVLHFSGHGNADGSLEFEDQADGSFDQDERVAPARGAG